ncbi:MAG: hypothetical protein KKA67_10000 [Spirochaetes bacterium]|nr:hypothetical protein [Spirochaetota bacterium]MBU1081701.1 hypothetical protein [Spirochaetota bacterium]
MKRFYATIAALCVVCGSSWAQDSSTDPSDDYVLQQARDKYAASSAAQSTETEPTAAEPAASGPTVVEIRPSAGDAALTTTVTVEVTQSPSARGDRSSRRRRYSPFVISFTPGIAFPHGIYDTSLSAAAIGAATGSVFGVQGAGVFNIAEGVQGLQGAGVFNLAGAEVRGFQGAGVFNIAESVHGVQGSGVFNIADKIDGVQMAGVFNIADEVNGLQLAGIINVADNAQGAMIGLVNVADELDGVAIGLVNIIGNGIHDIGFDYQFDSGAAYATYRSGTPFLYATFFAGQPSAELLRTTNGLSFGAGLGHRFKILFVTADIELGAETPVDTAAITDFYSALKARDMAAIEAIDPWNVSFGSLRATFGFGKRRGFGLYAGIKADFAPSGSEAIPASMRTAFGSPDPYQLTIFGRGIEIWPKWFLGVKF